MARSSSIARTRERSLVAPVATTTINTASRDASIKVVHTKTAVMEAAPAAISVAGKMKIHRSVSRNSRVRPASRNATSISRHVWQKEAPLHSNVLLSLTDASRDATTDVSTDLIEVQTLSSYRIR